MVPDKSGPRFAWQSRTGNRRRKKFSRFTAPVSGACVVGYDDG